MHGYLPFSNTESANGRLYISQVPEKGSRLFPAEYKRKAEVPTALLHTWQAGVHMFFRKLPRISSLTQFSCLSEYVREARKEMRILPEKAGERRAAPAGMTAEVNRQFPGFRL